jgi:hypothetical protein
MPGSDPGPAPHVSRGTGSVPVLYLHTGPDTAIHPVKTLPFGHCSGIEPERPAAERPQVSLWRHRDFLLLWCGQAVSELGPMVTPFALTCVAVTLGVRAAVS